MTPNPPPVGRIFYKPYWTYLVLDIICLVSTVVLVLWLSPMSAQEPFEKYGLYVCVFSAIWLITSYLVHRYVRVKFLKVGRHLLRLLASASVAFAVMECYSYFSPQHNYSIIFLLTIWLIMLALDTLMVLLSYGYFYATNEEPDILRAPDRGEQAVLKSPVPRTEERKKEIRNDLLSITPEKALKFLEQYIDLYSTNTYTIYTAEYYNIQKLNDFRFDAILNFMPLNEIRGINKLFGTINDKLPDNGLIMCCFTPQTEIKRQMLTRQPRLISFLNYTWYFFYKRVLPKLKLSTRFYFDLTEGHGRALSKAEVLGRLCYCGFEIVDEHKIEGKIYVIARRAFRPSVIQKKVYGVLVKLPRVGKNGKYFNVYKMRTMHPYSEYLQQYIYDHYGLQSGGKLRHDIRVSTLGYFMRRCWIDELPMLINLFKGEMKLVGVRPLSKQYFSLYSTELQELRTRHKPGLLPPFYADMPKTLDEIQDSEMRYLKRCEEKSTFTTDFIYFFKILYTIIFKRARSH